MKLFDMYLVNTKIAMDVLTKYISDTSHVANTDEFEAEERSIIGGNPSVEGLSPKPLS